MGLSAPKQKQRLVGAASTRNTAWLNDASAPGQRMLAQMGWAAGQSLGSSMPGLIENLRVAYKMDNKGIGAQRHEQEARASGKDVWVGGGGDLGSLFERLNAANGVTASSSTASSSAEEEIANKERKKKSRKEKASSVTEDDGEKRSKRKRKLENGAEALPDPNRETANRETADDDKQEGSRKGKSEGKNKDKGKPSKKEDKGKPSKKEDKEKKQRKTDAVSAVVQADPELSKDEAAVQQITQDVVHGRPVRLAHRAKFLRAKRMVSAADLASVNEILGIASTPSSAPATPQAGSGSATPIPAPKKYPGPGGAEIQLMDVDRRLVEEGGDASDVSSSSSSSTEEKNRRNKEGRRNKKKKEKEKEKEKKEEKRKSSSDRDEVTAKEKKPKKEKKEKKKRKEKKDGKERSKKEDQADSGTGTGVAAATEASLVDAEAGKLADAREQAAQIGTNAQGLSVFEYLNRRLLLRKAQIARQHKAAQDAVFSRAATVRA